MDRDMDNYTDTELETTPQTETIFDQPPLNFEEHVWLQQGNYLIDTCGTHPSQGVSIPSGTMLMKEDGRYTLVDEVSRK